MIGSQQGSNIVKLLWQWIVALVLAVPLLPSPAAAQGKRDTSHLQVHAQVRFEDNTAAPAGVLVDLEYGDGLPCASSMSDSGGRVDFIPDQPTVYIVRAKQPGYKEATARLDLQNTHNGYAILILKVDPNQPSPADAGGGTISVGELSIPNAARKEFDKATQAIQNHDLDEGVSHLKKAIELHNQYPQAYTMLGLVYNEQKKWKDAQGILETAIQQDPKAVEAYFQLGACLSRQTDYARAVNALNKGLELNPDAPHAPAAHYEIAKSYLALGQWQDANPHAAKAVAMEPHVASWHVLMGNINLKKGDGQGAISEFQAYLKLDPNGPAAASIHDMIPKIQAAMTKK